jgi:hypothetical protein
VEELFIGFSTGVDTVLGEDVCLGSSQLVATPNTRSRSSKKPPCLRLRQSGELISVLAERRLSQRVY